MLIDLHIDTLALLEDRDDPRAGVPRLHVDLPRLRQADVQAAVWAICTANLAEGLAGTALALRMLARARDLLERAAGQMRLVRSAADLEQCLAGDSAGMILGLEGVHSLAGEIALLDAFHDLGVRVLTLCWNSDTPFATGCALQSGCDHGLRPLGRELLRRASELHLVGDLAHASPRTLAEALPLLRRPFLVSHTACAALCAHPRNLSDAQMREVVAAGGLVGITLCPAFLAPPGATVSIATVCDHIEHALSVVGETGVALGSDFDGITRLPEGLRGVQDLPRILATLCGRGIADGTVAAVAGGNAARVLRCALPPETSRATSAPAPDCRPGSG